MSEYKLDMSKYTIDEQPRMWTDAEYREAFQSLYFEYHKIKSERDQHKAEHDTLIEENRKLKEENSKLKELTLRFDESHRINIREIDRLKEYISKLEDE